MMATPADLVIKVKCVVVVALRHCVFGCVVVTPEQLMGFYTNGASRIFMVNNRLVAES